MSIKVNIKKEKHAMIDPESKIQVNEVINGYIIIILYLIAIILYNARIMLHAEVRGT